MNVLISKNCRRTWLKLPCSELEMQEALEAVQSMSALDTNVLVVEVDDAVKELNTLVGQHVDLDHLNLLARCMDGLFGDEYNQFRAALHIRGVSDLKTMVNLTQEVYNYTIASPDASLTSIGKDQYMNLHGGCMTMEDESKIDFASIGRELTAERWRDMIRAEIPTIAEAHDIPLEELEWYGAFHNESHHPHVHLLLYSRDENYPGYIKKTGIDKIRRAMGTTIFADEIHLLYDEQTKRRNALNSESIDEFNELCMMVEQGLCTNPKIVKMVTDLSDRLKTVKGKKQYGYLPKSVKVMVDGIVDEFKEDERIKRLYDLWYECKCLIYQTYTDVPPKRLPLSQENAFKPIRNAVIKRASELAFGLADDEPLSQNDTHTTATSTTTTSGTSSGGNTTTSTSTNTSSSAQPTSRSNQYKPQILTKVTRLGKDIADTFRDRYQEMVDNPVITVDSKLKREIEAKKKGQRLSM